MATIIEVHEDKLEHLSEYAEKVIKYGKHLLECLEDMGGEEHYAERYGREKRPHDRTKPYGRDEYPRYY